MNLINKNIFLKIILIISMFCGIVYANESFDLLKEEGLKLTGKMPIKIDEVSTLTHIEFNVEDHTIVYDYHLNEGMLEDIVIMEEDLKDKLKSDFIFNTMKNNLVYAFCNDEYSLNALQEGVKFSINYTWGEEEEILQTIDVQLSDCQIKL